MNSEGIGSQGSPLKIDQGKIEEFFTPPPIDVELRKKIDFTQMSPDVTTPLSKVSQLKKLSTYEADDSSDEEDNKEIRKTHSAEKAFKKVLADSSLSKDCKLSILPHMLGLELLYSPLVDAIYYSNKVKILKDSELLSTEGEIRFALKEVFRDIAEPIFKELYSEFEIKHEKDLEEITDGILKCGRGIYKIKHGGDENSLYYKKIEPLLSQFYEILHSFAKSMSQKKVEMVTTSFSAIDLANKKNKEEVWKSKSPELIKKMKELGIVTGNDYTIGCLSTAKKLNKEAKDKKSKYDNIPFEKLLGVEKVAVNIIKASNSGKITNVLSKVQDQISIATIAEELEKEANESDSPIKKDDQGRSTRSNDPQQIKYQIDLSKSIRSPLLKKVIRNSSNISKSKKVEIDGSKMLKKFKSKGEKAVAKDFYEALKKNSGFKWNRSVLAEQFTLNVKNSYEALAGVRLFKRSQTRLIRQKEQEKHIDPQEVLIRAFSFNALALSAFETQEITELKNRSDFVTNLGSYGEVFLKMEKLKKETNAFLKLRDGIEITDGHLAQAIRNIFNGSQEPLCDLQGKRIPLEARVENPLLRFLVNTSYLLFVTEVARNPASLITNQMVLDLIIAGDMSWKEALAHPKKEQVFSGGRLPMSMTDAVKSARSLHSNYYQYIPFYYKYEGDEAKLNDPSTLELIAREAFVIRSWASSQKIDIDILLEKNSVKDFFSAVKNKINEWYVVPSVHTSSRIKTYSASFFVPEDINGDQQKLEKVLF